VGRQDHPHRDQGHRSAEEPRRFHGAADDGGTRGQAEILKAEGQKQGQILEAEGRREAAFRDAEAREREAQAEAAATTSVSQAIAAGDMQAINYFVAQRYIESLEAFARSPNQKTFILPVEATGIVGALAGIGEIAKQTFGPDTPPRGGTSVPRTGDGN